MQKIPINLAAPGMVLAKDVRKDDDDTGSPICGKGIVLTDLLISRLDRMGIQAVTVEGHPVKAEGEVTVDEMLKTLDRRFSKVAEDPFMKTLKDIYRKQIFRSMGEQDGG